MNLVQLIAQGENGKLEFKSTLESAAKIAKTLVAFANTGGGTLLVGVTDDKKICGIDSEEDQLSILEEASDRYCQPAILVRYEIVSVENKKVLVVIIPESEEKPHTVKEKNGQEKVYVRMNDKSVPSGKQTARSIATTETPVPDKALMQSTPVKTLLKYLQSNEYITVKRYAKLVNISERRASRLLMDLSVSQIIIPVERDKDVVYMASLSAARGGT